MEWKQFILDAASIRAAILITLCAQKQLFYLQQ